MPTPACAPSTKEPCCQQQGRRNPARGRRDGPAVPAGQRIPPAGLARQAEQLRADARDAVLDILAGIRRQAFQDHPGTTEAAAVHDQPQPARRDMHQLRR